MKMYETHDGVNEYIKMAEGYDLSKYKSVISKYLPEGKSLLEIGMGPGNDYGWLSEYYRVTGSDYSREFVKRVESKYPGADLMILDAVSLVTDKKFDALFSSKVFQHFSINQLKVSFERQKEILLSGGLIMHSFWIGGNEMDFDDMHFIYHDKDVLLNLIEENYTIHYQDIYTEFESDDSLFVIAEKK